MKNYKWFTAALLLVAVSAFAFQGGLVYPNFTSNGVGGGILGLDSIPNSGINTNLVVILNTNEVDCWQFVQKYPQTIGHLSIRVTTTFGAASHFGAAVYDSNKNRIITTGALDGTITGAIQTTAITSTVLTPGVYWMCATTDGANSGRGYGFVLGASAGAVTQFWNNSITNRSVSASVASVAGAPPTTLGTLTGVTTTSPVVIFAEP